VKRFPAGAPGDEQFSRIQAGDFMATITESMTVLPWEGLDLYRMTVDEYERLAEAGILRDPRVELLDGYLVHKMTKKPDHVLSVEGARDAILALNLAGWRVMVQDPVRIPDFDEPEPDLAVARGTRKEYRGRHPGPGDLALIVEVADTSLSVDRGVKRAAYGRAGISNYWIVNLVDSLVETYSQPDPAGGYQVRKDFRHGESLSLSIDGHDFGPIAVADILP
jgi:Uma2 family endonuclease